MPRAEDIIAVARREAGGKRKATNHEDANGHTKYHPGSSSYEWCCRFVWWVFKEAGASSLFYGGNETTSCETLFTYHKNKNQYIKPENLQYGDIVFFDKRSEPDGKANHVGIFVEYIDNKAKYYSIDGNTTKDGSGPSTFVSEKTRSVDTAPLKLLGGYRPDYDGNPSYIPDNPNDLYNVSFEIKNQRISFLNLIGFTNGNTTDEKGNSTTNTALGDLSASSTVKGLNPWYDRDKKQTLIKPDEYMLTKEQYVSMAFAINAFYDNCVNAVNELNALSSQSGIKNFKSTSFNRPKNISFFIKKPQLNENGEPTGAMVETLEGFEYITAESFNILMNAILEYNSDAKQGLVNCIKKYTGSSLHKYIEQDNKVYVVAEKYDETNKKWVPAEDATFVAAELFNLLGEAASGMSATFTVYWEKDEEEEEDDSE